MAGKIANCKNRTRSRVVDVAQCYFATIKSADCAWVASPFPKGEGEGEGFRISRVREFQTLTSILSLLQGRGRKTGCGFVSMGAGFIKVPGMDLVALPLKRPFHTGVC
jgi:hypothetical protein